VFSMHVHAPQDRTIYTSDFVQSSGNDQLVPKTPELMTVGCPLIITVIAAGWDVMA